jgi:hypothetical protein
VEQLEDRSLLATLSIGPSGLHVSEGGAATLQVTISQMQMQPVSGTCRTVAGTAIENSDYTGFSNQSFTIPPGATFANVSVYALNDMILESGETFSVELTSASGATINPSASSAMVTIDNVQTGGGGGSGGSLTVSLSVPSNVNEGEPFTLTGSINTTGSYQVNGAIDWGVTAGEGPTTFSVTTNPNGTFTVSHRYVDDGPDPGNGTPQDLQAITVTGTATPMMPGGGGNLSVTGSTSTTIHNVAPTPVFDIYNYMPIGGPWWVAAGTFQDVGLTDEGSLDIDWGDGSPHVTGTGLNVGSTFSLMHRYPPDGLSYTITITMTDDDTGSATYSKGFPLYLLDLDNDANNDGSINAADDPIEEGPPGAFIGVNSDDDNENQIADLYEEGPVSGEDDLEPFDLKWAPAYRPEINNYVGWKVKLQVAPYDVDMANNYPGIPNLNPHVYGSPDKSNPLSLVPESSYLTHTWIVNETVPSRLYLEARQGGPIGLRLLLTTPDGQEVELDQVAFVAATPTINLRIFNGTEPLDADQNTIKEPTEVPWGMRFTIGAFTVANRNDTDGDGVIDKNESPVLSAFDPEGHRLGTDEVDLMKLIIDRPVPYFPNRPVRLKVVSGDVKLWLDRNKVTAALGNDMSFPYWPSDAQGVPAANMTFWVEALSQSSTVRDIVIEASHGSAKDTVRATGVWAALTFAEYNTHDWADIAAEWNELPQHIKDTRDAGESNGTGLRPFNEYASNVILEEWKTFPAGLAAEPVYVDVSRRAEGKSWQYQPSTGVWDRGLNTHYEIMKDKANDDAFDSDESSFLNAFDHFFSTDQPGWAKDLPGLVPAGTKVMHRANFQEFIRFSFFERPTFNRVSGSRGSSFFDWKSKIKGEWDGTTWSRIGGEGPGTENDINEGHEDIPNAP